MKNCKLLRHQYNDITLADDETLLLCVQLSEDLFTAVTSAARIIQFTWRQEARFAEVQTAAELPLSNEDVICLAYSVEQEKSVIGTSEGNLMTYDVDSGVEPAGTLDSAVLAIAVSPDSQLIAILTGSGQLLLMNPFWEVEAETSVQVGLEAGQPVVHEETAQFSRGSVAVIWRGDSRYLATITRSSDEPTATLRIWSPEGCKLEHVGDADAEEAQGLLPMAAWQPNGRNIYCAQTASPQGDQKHTRICIFERNGLGHGSFASSTHMGGHILQMCWSPDSSILAISGTAETGDSYVQLWQRRNWHWYCAREVLRGSTGPLQLLWCEHSTAALFVISQNGRFERWELFFAADVSSRGSAAVIDGSEVLVTPLRLTVVPPPLHAAKVVTSHAVCAVAWGEVQGCECLALAHSNGISVVASVEGDLWEETAEELASAGGSNSKQGSVPSNTICSGQLELPTAARGLTDIIKSCDRLTWLHSELLVLIVSACVHQRDEQTLASACVMMHLSWPQQDESTGLWGVPIVTSCEMHMLQIPVTSCLPWDEQHVLLQDNEGKLSVVDSRGADCALSPTSVLPEHCQQLLVVKGSESEHTGHSQAPLILGLSGSGKLFCGQEVLASNVNSMCLRHWGPGGRYLLVTTRSQMLFCVQLDQKGNSSSVSHLENSPHVSAVAGGSNGHLSSSQGSLSLSRAATRAIEAGAELVAVPPGTSLAVLQMPRGNLEGVHVRALTVASVTENLLANRYADAMEEAAANRLDLNVLVDFQWPRFIDHTAEFVKQVKADSICDLLSALRTEVCAVGQQSYDTASAPADPLRAERAADVADLGPSSTDKEAGSKNKVNVVCQAVQPECIKVGGAHLRAALMAFVRMQPQDLESAVGVIQSQRRKEMDTGSQQEGSVDAASLAKFLLLHVDAEQAYRAALCRYDLRMAYFLISLSQKDPAEHLLELERFHAIQPEAMQHHAIDAKLGRHLTALKNAVLAGNEHYEIALQYAQMHDLLRELVDLLGDEPELLLQTQIQYAKYLEQAGRLPDAAVAYLACKATNDAMRCYEYSGEWQMAFALLLQSKPDAARIRTMAASLVDHLKATGRPSEAGTVAATYLQDGNLALQHFVEAGEWRLALGVIGQMQNSTMLTDTLKPAAAGAAVTMLSDLLDDHDRVDKYWSRLKQLRAKREQLATKVGLDGGLQDTDALPDNFTDVVSLATDMSAYTDRSVKNSTLSTASHSPSTIGGQGGAKSKKKGRSGKIRQGTPEEEQKLCLLLSDLAPSPELCTQGSQLAELLVFFGHQDDAAKLQRALDGYVKAFIGSAEDMLSTPAPPANGSMKAAEDAKKTSIQLQVKLHTLKAASWKWALLRPVQE